MNSSGFKRGLAVSAVSALAISGISLATSGSASADTLDNQSGGGQLLSQFTGGASVKNDGQNTTVRLEAIAPSSVSPVTFTYQLPGGQEQKIQTVTRNDDGAFSYEWTVPDNVTGATNVTLRVRDGSTISDPLVDAQTGVNFYTTANAESVNLDDASQIGYFTQPYGNGGQIIGVDGTSSAGGTVGLQVLGNSGVNNPAGNATVDTTTDPDTFAGAIDIDGYDFTATNEIAIGATSVDGLSDDVEAYTLYDQEITQVTAEAEDTNVPAGGSTTVTVTVLDQNGEPIAGARVAPRDTTAGVTPTNGTDQTDGNGEVEFTQPSGTTTTYYADTTGQTGFQSFDEESNAVTVNDFDAGPESLDGDSAVVPDRYDTATQDAPFDVDEYAQGDITVQVRDEDGNAFDTTGQTLRYRWVVTPFDGSNPVIFPANGGTTPESTETNGEFEVPLPQRNGAYISGTYELFASLGPGSGTGTGAIAESKVLEFKAGQAAIELVPSGSTTAQAGGQVDVDGTLALEDGTGLVARSVSGAYTRGTQGSDPSKDAGFLNAQGNIVLNETYTTDADGGFDSTIDDPGDTSQGTEVGGEARYDTNFTPADTLDVDFASATPPANSTVTIQDPGNNQILEPGYVDTFTATVTQAVGQTQQPVAGQIVTLTITDSEAFFTTGQDRATGAEPNGEYQNSGQTITVATDDNGQVTFNLSMGRDEGFDDDGRVNAVVQASIGSATDTATYPYSTRTNEVGAPRTGGAVDIVISDEDEQDGPTDPAEVNQVVDTDVYTYDQFGNEVGGQQVTVSTNDDDAAVSDTEQGLQAGNKSVVVLSDYEDDGDVVVTTDEEDVVTLTAQWQAPRDFANGGANTRTLTDTVNVDFSDAVIEEVTIASSPEGPVEPGTAVTETATVTDDNGEPAVGVQVIFRVTDPNGAASEFIRTTNGSGQAEIVVVGAVEGTYTVTAEATDGSVTVSSTDTIIVEDDPARAQLFGKSNGKKADRLRVVTENTDANSVRLFKVNKKTGRNVLVQSKTLGDDGVVRFRVKDRNGKKFTRYIAKVGSGADSITTNTRGVR